MISCAWKDLDIVNTRAGGFLWGLTGGQGWAVASPTMVCAPPHNASAQQVGNKNLPKVNFCLPSGFILITQILELHYSPLGQLGVFGPAAEHSSGSFLEWASVEGPTSISSVT